jgi:hypothetical protein
MKRNLIKTDNYLLVVDESVKEINNGEYFLLGGKHVNMWRGSGTRIMTDVTDKIISHIPLNGAPYLDGVDVLPFMDNGEKHEYTTEDILDAWELGAKEGLPLTRKKKEDLFDFLHQPKLPIAFESVDIDVHEDTGLHLKKVGTEPDKITNSEGRIEWVGKYIYE